MSADQIVLLVCVVAGCVRFLAANRRVDAFTVAFFSAVIYFLPGLVGYTLSPVTPSSPVKLPVELEPEAIRIMAMVVVGIAAASFVWDFVDRRSLRPAWVLESAAVAPLCAFLLGATGLLFAWLETGGAVFAQDKRDGIEVVGRGHLLWEMGASLGAVLGFAYRQRLVSMASWGLLLLDMWAGFRYAFAMSLIATLLLWFGGEGPKVLLRLPLRYVGLVLMAGLAVISYQNLKEPVRYGDWAEVSARLSDPSWYIAGVLTSEPFTTQTVLNEIVRREFRTTAEHLWAVRSHLILFSGALGDEDIRFNKLYQPALFPQVDHGLANNMWAQMWSAGGWPLLVGFMVVFVVGLGLLSRCLRSPDPAVRGCAALSVAYWAFYVHRNELLGYVGYQKQVLIVWIVCVVIGICLTRVSRLSQPSGVGGRI
jgi:hypothetical protein